MSRAVILLLLSAVLHPSGALAQSAKPTLVDGAELNHQCKWERKVCQGYVAGVADVMGSIKELHGFTACIPVGVTVKQHTEAVVKWLNKHPGSLSFTAHSIVAEALAAAYPCK